VAHEAWAVAIVVLSAAFFACTELVDGDLGFHLATGREVLSSGHIPSTNVLSYTNPQHPWLLHQWLPGVLFELLHRKFGLLALQLLRMGLVSVTWLAAYGAARLSGATALVAAAAMLLGESAAAFRFELRPYLFTHLALAVVIASAAAFLRAEQAGDSRRARRSLAIGALTAAGAAHLHAGVIDSWLAFFALAVGCACEPLRVRLFSAVPLSRAPFSAARTVLIALVSSIALAALTLSLYHPYGARVLLFPFDMGSDAHLAQHLVEFRPPFRFPFSVLAAYWTLLGLCVVAVVLRVRALHPFWPMLMLGFLLLSLKHARLAYDFALAGAPFLALALAPVADKLRPTLTLLALTLLAPLLVLQHYELSPFGVGLSARTWPPYLFDYLEQNQLDGHAYVSDAWAAPLLGRRYPREKAFFDNRFEAYPREFWEGVYQRIRYGQPGWDSLLDRYGVEVVLMRYTTPGEAELQGHKPNLRQLLAKDPRWTLVTFDDLGELFVRTRGKHQAFALAHALPALDPDGAHFFAPPRTLLAALSREVASGNPSARVRVFLAYAALDAGDRAQALHWATEAANVGEPSATPLLMPLRDRLLNTPR
jgi:hypothetical protein